jgi:hypothetical protein
MATKTAKRKGKKQHSGGEAKKKKEPRFASQDTKGDLADAQDHKRGNIGPSGQGAHRGRERANVESQASGRPNVTHAGSHGRLKR